MEKLSCAPFLICDIDDGEKKLIAAPLILREQIENGIAVDRGGAGFIAPAIADRTHLNPAFESRGMARSESAVSQKFRRQRNRFAGFDKFRPSVGRIQIGAKPIQNLITEFPFDALALSFPFRLRGAVVARPHQLAVEMQAPIIDADIEAVEKLCSKS